MDLAGFSLSSPLLCKHADKYGTAEYVAQQVPAESVLEMLRGKGRKEEVRLLGSAP